MSSYTHRPLIQAADIDIFGHVNNEVYLRWVLEAASAHAASVGFPASKYVERGAGFVVRRHELEYRLPTFLKDEIKVETWTDGFEGASGFRNYEITNEKTGKTILTARSKFVYVDLKTGRPLPIPQEIVDAFAKPSAHDRS